MQPVVKLVSTGIAQARKSLVRKDSNSNQVVDEKGYNCEMWRLLSREFLSRL